MEESRSVGVDALLVGVDGVVEVVAVLGHVLHHMVDFLLEIGDTSSVVEENKSNGREEKNRQENYPNNSRLANCEIKIKKM